MQRREHTRAEIVIQWTGNATSRTNQLAATRVRNTLSLYPKRSHTQDTTELATGFFPMPTSEQFCMFI